MNFQLIQGNRREWPLAFGIGLVGAPTWLILALPINISRRFDLEWHLMNVQPLIILLGLWLVALFCSLNALTDLQTNSFPHMLLRFWSVVLTSAIVCLLWFFAVWFFSLPDGLSPFLDWLRGV